MILFFALSNIVELLLKYEASPIVPDDRGNTPLHLAAWTGDSTILKSLFIAGITGGQVNEQVSIYQSPQTDTLHFVV